MSITEESVVDLAGSSPSEQSATNIAESSGPRHARARRRWIDRFELAPSSASAIPALDGLRALAVVSIFLRHSWGLSGQPSVIIPVPFGDGNIDLTPLVVMLANGVDLFFVLSGFLLARSFVKADLEGRPRPNLARYARTRAYRILPAYYFAFLAVVLFFAPQMLPSADVYSWPGFVTIVSHLGVVQTVNPVAYGRWGIASPYWTLTIEVLFYAVLPFVVAAFYRRRVLLGVAASFVIAFGWLWLARNSMGSLVDLIVNNSHRPGAGVEFARFFLSRQLIGYALSFGLGIAAASLFEQSEQMAAEGARPWWGSAWFGRACLASGVVILVVSMTVLGRLTLTHTYYDGIKLLSESTRAATFFYYAETTSMAIAFGLILYGTVLLRDGVSTAPLRLNGLRIFGLLGFAIYLWHMPLLYLYNGIEPIATLTPGWHWLWLSLGAGAATVLVGVVSFFLVEKPMVARGRAKRDPAVSSGTR